MLAILARLFFWQVIQHDFLIAKAESQRIITKEVPSNRGDIIFSDGSMLASTQPTYLVFAQPKLIKDKNVVANALSEIFWEERNWYKLKEEIDETVKRQEIEKIKDDIFMKITKDLFWVSLGRYIGIASKERIEKLNLAGVGFDQTTARFYPESSSSAHLLGFVGSNAYGQETGYFGLEGFYNGELRGKTGLLKQEKDAMGLPILIGEFFSRKPEPGKKLTLNIDRTVQYVIEEKLKKGIQKYGAKGASAIVMDPKTGNILGMASLPSYDPGRAFDFPTEYFKNPIIADGYEPGSTFKVLVMAAGINEKVIKPDTVCDKCSGPLKLSGYTIRTWNNKYSDQLTMTDAIIHSDNTGMVYVANKLGLEKFYNYIRNFGFGELTNIDLQDEYSPYLREYDDWKEIDLATGSFGQGISVTAIQVVRAVGAIANGGKLMEPHIVRSVTDSKGEIKVQPKVVKTPVTEETAKTVTEMMVKAVDEGESKFAKPKGYKIAGKTGTAQIAVGRGYDADKTIASFVGFAPADDPKFVMLVRYHEPTSSIYGSETAAPTFFEIAKELFTYYGIAPGQ